MFSRLWNFVKRHRKKFIFTGVFAGGIYFSWKVLVPRLQERLLRRLLEELSKQGGDAVDPAADAELAAAAARRRRRRRSQFRHKQEEADRYSRERLVTLRDRHHALFCIDECNQRIAEAPREEKLQRFRDLSVACISQTVSSVYTLSLLMFVYRVVYNIMGRDWDSRASTMKAHSAEDTAASAPASAEDAEEDAAHVLFLDSARYFEEHGVDDAVASTVRRAVRAHFEASALGPQSPVTSQELERLWMEICTAVNGELLSAGAANGLATLLPESLDKALDPGNKKVQSLLNEARDCLESPQLHEALRVVVNSSMKRVIGSLGDAAADPSAAALADGRSALIAKLHGPLLKVSSNVLSAEKSNEFVVQFGKEPIVEELCQAIYFDADALES